MDGYTNNINNCDASKSTNEEETSLQFYRAAASEIALLPEQHLKSISGYEGLEMSLSQLSYCSSFFKEIFHRPISAGELMFADNFCKLLKRSFNSLSPEELLLNESYIAQTYGDIMNKRAKLFPDYSTHMSLSDIFSFASTLISRANISGLPFSESKLFSAESSLKARLSCLADGYLPEIEENGLCMGKCVCVNKSVSCNDHCAIIYCGEKSSHEALSELIPLIYDRSGISKAAVCRGSEIFELLLKTYSAFSIATASLPTPKENELTEAPLSVDEVIFLDATRAFFTDELFGENALLIFGKKSALSLISHQAKKLGLSSFMGIRPERSASKKKKISRESLTVKIESSLFKTLSDMSNNIRIKIPEHKPKSITAAELIPTVERIYSKTSGQKIEEIYTVKLKLSDNELPFQRALLAAVMLVISAASNGIGLKNGELAFSFRAILPLGSQMSFGSSLAAILGLYRVQTELCIKDENSCLLCSENDDLELTLSLRAFSSSPASISFRDGDAENFLKNILDENMMPDFDILRELISGNNI